MNNKNCLDNAILASYEEFKKNKLLEISSIEEWIIQSLMYLYLYGDKKGFLFEYQNDLNISKSNILELIVDRYVKDINNLDEEEIQDYLKRIIKETINHKGLEIGKESLIKFIENSDITIFEEIGVDVSKINQYSSLGLVNVLCRGYVKDVVQNDKKRLQNKNKSSKIQKKEFYPYEFFMVGGNNREFDINDIVSSMESVRNGKL